MSRTSTTKSVSRAVAIAYSKTPFRMKLATVK